jgi:O-acetyl-ADP-ribose deacetylase (regulator of RNase III)
MIVYESGDIVELAKSGKIQYLIHGCNCQSVWGSGLAKQLKEVFPQAYQVDKDDKRSPSKKIGDFSYYKTGNLTIINAYTQFDYGTNYRRVEYGSIKRSFECIFSYWPFINEDEKMATVKIGAGLAGGEWSIIEEIINEVINFYGVTLHVLSKK